RRFDPLPVTGAPSSDRVPGLLARNSAAMNPPRDCYRTHTCANLTPEHAEQTVDLSGWVHRKRDHGGLLFIDLRDHYGLTQCVFPSGSKAFETASALRLESVIHVSGRVV